MPAVSKKALQRLEGQKNLLERRRNPIKGRIQKFKVRPKLWPVVIYTETDGSEPARDIPYRINAVDSVTAVRNALADFETRIKSCEMILSIHVGEPEWLEREPVGR